LSGRSELANGVAGTRNVGGDTESRVVLAAAAADVHDAVPFAHASGAAGGGFSAVAAGLIADHRLRVPFAVGVETASINVRAVGDVAARAAAEVGVVEDAETSKGEARGRAESFALLTADHVVSIPHAATIGIASVVGEVAMRAGADASGVDGPLAGAVSEASLGCLPFAAILFAVVCGAVPGAARIDVARSLLAVLHHAGTRAPLAGNVPVAERIHGARVEVDQHRAVRLTEDAGRIPDAFRVRVAASSLIVGVLALFAADGAVPSAHGFTKAALLNDKRIGDGELDGVDGGAGTTTLSEFVAPHASDIGAALNLVEVLRDATFNALSIGDGATGVVGAFGDGQRWARRLAAVVGVIPAALRASGAGGLVRSGRAGSDTNTVLSVPSAFAVSSAIGLVEPAEVALFEATSAVPQAHGFTFANSLETDAAARGAASTGATVPHAFVGFGDANAVVHLIAALVASVVDVRPLAEGVAVAGVDALLESGFLFVVGASVLAHHGVVVPAARFDVLGACADVLGCGAVHALHLTTHGWVVVAEPLAELRSEAERFGVVERSTEASARVTPFIPAAFGVAIALGLGLVTVLAELLAFVASRGGVTAHAVGDALVGRKVVAGRFASSRDRVPHTPRIRFASVGSGVQDGALVAARRSADAEPLASRIGSAARGVLVLIASTEASAARLIPLAEPFGRAGNTDWDGAAIGLAHVSLFVEHALFVGNATSGVEGVSDVAASVAFAGNVIPDADRRQETTFALVAEAAELLALAGDSIEDAVGVSLAASLVHAASFASGLADLRSRQPLASGDGSAGTLRSEAGALGVAELCGDVPAASRVSAASVKGGVAVHALHSANSSGAVPDAGSSGRAVIHGFDEVALLRALGAEDVPQAQVVACTRDGVSVGIAA
jgi:hypothetical protein